MGTPFTFTKRNSCDWGNFWPVAAQVRMGMWVGMGLFCISGWFWQGVDVYTQHYILPFSEIPTMEAIMTDINLPDPTLPVAEPAITPPAPKAKVPHPLPVYKPMPDDGKKGSKLRKNLDVISVFGGIALLIVLGLWKLGELLWWLF